MAEQAYQVTRYALAEQILIELGVKNPGGLRHRGARRALVAWMGPESGWDAKCDGTDGARFNPLNTTMSQGLGNCVTGKYNTDPGVRNYATFQCGALAVALTLRNTPNKNYEQLIATISKDWVRARTVLHSVSLTGWGTFLHPDHTPDSKYVDAIADTYKRNRDKYNSVLVGP
jgi:hypothetical protein